MSDRSFDGYVRVQQVTGQGMLTLRGNLASTKLKAAVTDVMAMDMPKRGMGHVDGAKALTWMSPDELLITVPLGDVAQVEADLNAALAGQHVLLVDTSDARASFTLNGAAVREVMAKLSPIDMHPKSMPVGSFRRTRIAQVAGGVFMASEDQISIICFRSVQDYMFDLLSASAKHGTEVNA